MLFEKLTKRTYIVDPQLRSASAHPKRNAMTPQGPPTTGMQRPVHLQAEALILTSSQNQWFAKC